MTPNETAKLLAAFAGTWRIEIDDATAHVWANVLSDVDVHLANEAGEMYVRTESFMPKPAEFLSSVRELEQRAQRDRISERNESSSYRCDGTRWRCHSHHGKCPIDCVPRRMEPCPTCNPTLHEWFGDEKLWRQYLNGKKISEGVSVPACEAHDREQPVTSAAAASAARLAAQSVGAKYDPDTDWSHTRRDLE